MGYDVPGTIQTGINDVTNWAGYGLQQAGDNLQDIWQWFNGNEPETSSGLQTEISDLTDDTNLRWLWEVGVTLRNPGSLFMRWLQHGDFDELNLNAQFNELEMADVTDLLNALIGEADARGQGDALSVVNAQITLNRYQNAVDADAQFPDHIEAMRTRIATWKPNNLADLNVLDQLQGKIHLMWAHDILAGVWVGDVIQAFQRFHDAMRSRHDLLSQMEASLDRIDWLSLTPEQRIVRDRMETIQAELIGLDSPPCPLDDNTDFDTFRECAEDRLRLASDEMLESIYYSLGLGGEFGYRASASELIDLIAPGGRDPFEIEQASQEFDEDMARLFFVLGFVPVVGAFIDLVSALVALAEGRYGDAFWNLLFVAIDYDDFIRLGKRMSGMNGIADNLIRRADGALDEFASTVDNSRTSREILEGLEDTADDAYERAKRNLDTDSDGSQRPTYRDDITESSDTVTGQADSSSLLDDFDNLREGNIGEVYFGVYLGLKINVPGVDRTLIINTLRKLDELVSRYPQVGEQLRGIYSKVSDIDFYPNGKTFDAYAALVESEIWINQEAWNYGEFFTEEGLLKFGGKGVSYPGGSTINFESIITHEFGHGLRNQLISNGVDVDTILSPLRERYDTLLKNITSSTFDGGYVPSALPGEVFAEIFAANELIQDFDLNRVPTNLINDQLLQAEYRTMVADFMSQIANMIEQAGG